MILYELPALQIYFTFDEGSHANHGLNLTSKFYYRLTVVFSAATEFTIHFHV